MAKAPTLLGDVKAKLPTRRGFAPWYECLPQDLAGEVQRIKCQWRAGKLKASKTGLGNTLSRALKARGIQIGHAGVIKWLERP